MITLTPPVIRTSNALILVVGSSGSGKDSLIAYAKEVLKLDQQFVFARRVITREALASAEEHDTMTIEQFSRAKIQNEFALHWSAHGLAYGVRSDVITALRAGQSVIVNVSRNIIGDAEALGFPVVVISVLCRPELLAQRIAARGRESMEDILLRLERDVPIKYTTAKLVEIRNETTLEEAAAGFIAAIRGV